MTFDEPTTEMVHYLLAELAEMTDERDRLRRLVMALEEEHEQAQEMTRRSQQMLKQTVALLDALAFGE